MTSNGSHPIQSMTDKDDAKPPAGSLATEQQDLKELKSKYGSQLSTLKELFPEWSDDDLLFAIRDAEGDLELAVDRISEGHVFQWGEVKSKKQKKEAAVQKAKANPPPAQSVQPRTERSHSSRTHTDRPKRGGRGAHASRGGHKHTPANNTASWGQTTKTTDSGSWANVAAAPKVSADDTWDASAPPSGNSNWDAPSTSAGDGRGSTRKEETSIEKPASSEPKTWASLLKKQEVKPEPAKEEDKENQAPVQDDWNTDTQQQRTTTDGWNAPNDDAWNEPVNTQPTTTTAATDGWGAPSEQPISSSLDLPSEPAKQPESQPATTEQDTLVQKRQSTIRRLKQDAPVVLPNNSATLSAIGVKFGSLSLDDDNNENVNISTVLQKETRETTTVTSESQAQKERHPSTDAFAKQQEAVPQQPTLQNQPPHSHQQPMHSQQFGMDQLASGYSSYLPNQPPAVMSGFGINPMGSVPDYGIYGSDAHRAAAMGYYDPAAYNQSPSTTAAAAYSARDKHSQEGSTAQPHTSAQTPGAGQQMYANMPYYPYYYMPNQFGYQQSAYGQPFMNKNMYPNMYQHSAGKPNAGAATSPYGSASPYSQSVYGQSVSGVVGASGYDDMAGLQHHLASANLHDYQKSYSQQLPGFLGQQPSAQQTPSAQQGAGKADQLNKAGPTAAGTSNGHQQPQQHQQQGLQQGMNYFGQSFPYYPQQFQQFPHQPAQQQALPNQQQQQQQSPMGRQQPYWSQ